MMVGWKVGKGNQVSLWFDTLMGSEPICLSIYINDIV